MPSEETFIEWEEERFVWDWTQLEHLNKQRQERGQSKIEIVMKHNGCDLGIRAHPEMGFCKCLYSMFLIYQNEFIFIWLYFGFVVYFWVQIILILTQDASYGFTNQENYSYMLVATLAAATAVTSTLVYLIFYSVSQRTKRILGLVQINFQYLATYSIALVWLIAEMSWRPVKLNPDLTLQELLMYIVLSFYVVTAILININDNMRLLAFWLTCVLFAVILLVDLIGLSNHEQFRDFYLPVLITLSLVVLASIFVFFGIPERFCEEHRPS
jgi:hypothetical protein